MTLLTHVQVVFTWVLDHIRVVQLFEDGDLLIHSLQRAFGLRWALRSHSGPSGRRPSCILSHQTLLGQDFHGLRGRGEVRTRECE
uniref:Uncharacterized protein n=1 Tax=Electrophorus electricus TaxID=8005 RepID=A0AAY5F424_ELEEL